MNRDRSPLRGPPACCGTFDRDLRLATASAATSGLWVELQPLTVRVNGLETKIRGACQPASPPARMGFHLPAPFARLGQWLTAIGDRSQPRPAISRTEMPETRQHWAAGQKKVRFIRLRQRPGEILDAGRPQEGEYRPRSIFARGIWGQNERGNTQMLGGWTRDYGA